MFCEKCGYQNIDGAKFCAGCGEMLASEPEQKTQFADNGFEGNNYAPAVPPYEQPVQNQGVYQQVPSYPQPSYSAPVYAPAQKPTPKKSAGAIVVYMIGGALALLWALMTLLPQISVLHYSRNFFGLFGEAMNAFSFVSIFSRSDAEVAQLFAVLCMIVVIILLILDFVWALLSFLRARAAGVFGLIASIIAINFSVLWAIVVEALLKGAFGSGVSNSSFVPVFMIVIAIAGLVFAILQLTKKNRVK